MRVFRLSRVLTEKAVVEKAAEESGYREVYCCKCCSQESRCEYEFLSQDDHCEGRCLVEELLS